MTVCLTGDVHHMSLGTRDQHHMDRTEVEAALVYADIAASEDVAVTLFVTGRAAVEEPGLVRQLTEMDNVEVGGHNYWAFDTPVHTVWRAVERATGGRIGSWNGPTAFQRWEVARTLSALRKRGASAKSWRDHAYRRDDATPSILRNAGVTHLSDDVSPDGRVDRDTEPTRVPINTPPDHEHVYHAFRTQEHAEETNFEGPFGSRTVSAEAWVEWTLSTMHATGGTATVLAHPSCMRLADDFEAFRKFCRTLRDERTVTMSEV